MKLGTRFVLLSLSIFAVPIVLAVALGIGQWLTDDWTRSVGSYTAARRWIGSVVRDEAADHPASLLAARPKGIDLAVVAPDGEVLDSTITEVAAGSRVAVGDLMDALREPGIEREIILTRTMDGSVLVASLARPRALEWRAPWVPTVLAPVLFLTPMIGISLWIVRDLRRSIVTLRDAAVRIAAGDLDFELDTSGNDEFAELRASFETMRRTIRDEYARRARFTMGVSHDLKTPLSLIKGYAEAIEDGLAADPETLARSVRIIRERSDLLQERISHLIEFLKLDTGEWHSTLRPIAIGRFLEETAATAVADAKLVGREVVAQIDLPTGRIVRLDPVLVRRALENLVQNALEHSDGAHPVGVEARFVGKAIRITVANRGETLSAESLELLSEPLYRGDAARSRPGFGLGLSIVRSVVESHGWSLAIDDSSPGESRFVITIPETPAESSLSK